ncbi:MAG: S8 family serine peptidase [Byssovorax sp.]
MPIVVTPLGKVEQRAAHPKLDPRLAALVELEDSVYDPADPVIAGAGGDDTGHEASAIVQRRSGPLAFLRAPRRRLGGTESARGYEVAYVEHIPVFVTVTKAEVLDAVALRAGGFSWRSRAGNMATAEVSLGHLRELETIPEVLAVEWTGGAKPHGTAAVSGGGVSPRRTLGLGPDVELDGTGVVIGVVDIEGIDIYHPDFLLPRLGPRVIAIWDQAPDGTPGARGKTPTPYGYGTAYSRDDIAIELDPNRRFKYGNVAHAPLKVSHGTSVAGVAAGSGAEDPEARGIAPGSKIVFVDTMASGAGALAAMTEIAEAVDFVFRQAGDRPVVVNISLGDDLGPRDGESPVERYFDRMLAERDGRAIVIAAGNSHERASHAVMDLKGGDGTATLLLDTTSVDERSAVIEIWYDRVESGEQGIAAEIIAPGGEVMTPRLLADGVPRAFDLGATRVLVASVARYPESSNALLRVEMFARERGGQVDAGVFTIRLHGGTRPARAYAWLDHPTFCLRVERAGEGFAAPITITSPASCRTAISVGACNDASDEQESFAGRGPGRHGVEKPDVLACGVALRAPSANTPDRYHATFSGTSAAAPLITGLVALAFQHAAAQGRRLRPAETRALVRAAAGELASAGAAGGVPEAGSASPPGRARYPAEGGIDRLFAIAGVVL